MACLMVKVNDRERSHEIDEDVLFIGSAEDAGIRVTGGGVAPKHCQVLRAGDLFRVLDLGSDAGTLVNGERITQKNLQDGDEISIGGFSITFQAGPATSAPAPARPATRPAAPARPAPRAAASRAGGGGRRARGSSRASSAGATRRPVGSAAGPRRSAHSAARRAMAARDASGGGSQPLVRRRLRESRGLPMPYFIGLMVVTLALSGGLIYWFVNRETTDITGMLSQFHEALDRKDRKHAADIITRLREMIDESHPHWDYVDRNYREYAHMQQNLEKMAEDSASISIYLHNIKPFYEDKIDTDNPQYKDDPTTARYFVDYRLQPYLDRFPDSPNCGQVKTWVQQLKPRYDETAPFPKIWWDYELISAFEERLEHYGESYRVLSLYIARHPHGEHLEECQKKVGWALERAKKFWVNYCLNSRLQPALEATKPNYSGALRWALKGWKNLKGIPELERQILSKAEEIRDLAAASDVLVSLDGFH